MKMLAVSTSSRNPSAALLTDGGAIVLRTDESGLPHSVSLGTLVDELLLESGVSLEDIDALAVDIGPGSFTGVRIGVSFMNALAFSLGKRVFGISSLNALRHAAGSSEGTVCTMLDARNGNGYAAVFKGGKCVLEPCACVQSEMLAALPEGAAVVGDCRDCGGENASCNAEMVIKEALCGASAPSDRAVPLYLRPSQAERMRDENRR